ncbi:zinc finger, GRF-type containing protein [Tanacetum coccineum]
MALCFCGLPAVTRTSWTDTNPGRKFLGCPQIEGQRCIYFGWLDPPMYQRDMLIISGLLRARNGMEADMMVLVQANRKLKKYLILSWVAFALFPFYLRSSGCLVVLCWCTLMKVVV